MKRIALLCSAREMLLGLVDFLGRSLELPADELSLFFDRSFFNSRSRRLCPGSPRFLVGKLSLFSLSQGL